MSEDNGNTPGFNLEALDEFESDGAPSFIIAVGRTAPRFDLLYRNRKFREGGFQNLILAEQPEALRFRSWAQALGDAIDTSSEFAGCTWSCQLSGKSGALKLMKGTLAQRGEFASKEDHRSNGDARSAKTSHVRKRLDAQQTVHAVWDAPVFVRNLPQAQLNARWEGIQTIMEMSDIGVFEYNTRGELMHANDAWYRLRYVRLKRPGVTLTLSSLYPRDVVDHAQFSFINLIYPDDQELVMSMWNTLSQGSAVSFEMRWKTQNEPNDTGKWTLTSCVPIFDDAKVLISIAGNMIDIDAQKKSQEATHARLEALEQARMSELKFARFAQLSPTAIYIFVPETGTYESLI